MKIYFQWAWQQFYLLYFWPARFVQENGGLESGVFCDWRGRSNYIVRLLPFVALLATAAHLCFALATNRICGSYDWSQAWVGEAVGLMLGVALGVVASVEFGLAISLVASVVFSVVAGVMFGRMHGMAYGGPISMMIGTSVGVGLGVVTFVRTQGTQRLVRVHGGLTRRSLARMTMFFVVFIGAPEALGGMRGGMLSALTKGLVYGMAGAIAYIVAYVCVFYRLLDFLPLYSLARICSAGLRSDLSRAHCWWRRHPLAWNEVVWLPLPRAGEFLAQLVLYDRDYGFEKIAFVAAERPLQQRAARNALVEVALNDLNATTTIDLLSVSRVDSG